MAYLYQSLANRLAGSIDSGLYAPGDRLPGVRVTSRNEGVSPATVVAAYERLEVDGYVESRPRSGFFVRPRRAALQQEPGLSRPASAPKAVTGAQLVAQIVRSVGAPEVVQLGANIPHSGFLPTAALSRELKAVARDYVDRLGDYEAPPGLPRLRHGIARRMADIGCLARPDDILITHGAQEAVYLALKCVTRPGDVVAVESPTYYGILQVLDSLGLKALEIPTHARTGISIDALTLALEKWPIRACVLVPNFSNPLGALLPDVHKRALLDLFANYPDVTVIEDDVYGDLAYHERRPSILKSYDQRDQVIYCASFSKSLSAGLRIGWIVSSRHAEQLAIHNFVHNCGSSLINQLALAALLEKGSYERHLRSMRVALAQNLGRLSERIAQHFPEDVKVSRPEGGLSVWVELPQGTDTTALFHRAYAQGISIAPGQTFSTDPHKYRHCMRLNAGVAWNERLESALQTLGQLIKTA
ncbi:MAG: PLP-dependent aminotransferase family protein [Pseudomonadota bacterium]